MLNDADPRIRNEAINALCEFNFLKSLRCQKNEKYSNKHVIIEFISDILSQEVPYSLKPSNEMFISLDSQNNQQIERYLGKCLFDLTNMLLELESKEQLVNLIIAYLIYGKY